MKKIYLLLAASVVTSAMLVGGLTGTAKAWHPVGKIDKLVQNVTAGGQLVDAEDEEDAVAAKPGDTLKYVVKVWNAGQPNAQGHNDMVDVTMTDKLPDGVELVSDPAKRDLVEKIARLKPGESKTFTYEVKVIKKETGIVENTACFTGDSEVKDAPQKGCADANVKVTVEGGLGGEEPKQETLGTATTLPVTGAGSLVGIFAGVSSLGYAAHRFTSRKR